MQTITIVYKLKWRIKKAPHYCWSTCKKLFNTNRGREVKKTIKGLTPGYWIGRDFIPLSKMKAMIELIPKSEKLPF
jgi:hypothetical protein